MFISILRIVTAIALLVVHVGTSMLLLLDTWGLLTTILLIGFHAVYSVAIIWAYTYFRTQRRVFAIVCLVPALLTTSLFGVVIGLILLFKRSPRP
jgi:hypothetical protein